MMSIPGHTKIPTEQCPECPAPADPVRALNWMGFSGVSWLQPLCDTPGSSNVGRITEFCFTIFGIDSPVKRKKKRISMITVVIIHRDKILYYLHN